MRRSVSYIVASLALVGGSYAQDLQIAGTVVNSVTGAPIRGALVRLQCIQSDKPINKADVTETGGGFRISGLTTGRCFGDAEKPGFSSLRSAAEPIEVPRSIDNLVLRLEPLAKIYGRVLDGGGEHLSRAAIRLFASTIDEGRRVVKRVRTVNTDGAGQFRLWNLEPGDYYLLAAGRGGGTALVVAHAAPAPNSHESFAPVYFGGAADRASATPITVKAGQEFEANLTVTMRTAYRVRGRLRNARPHQPIDVELLRGGHDVSAARGLVNGATGQFEIQDVASGTYTLRATQSRGGDPIRAEQDIEIGERDVNGLTLDLLPQVDVTGRVQIDAPAERRWMRAMVTLTAEDAAVARAASDDEGKVAVKVFPGRYRFRVENGSAYAVSATSGNVDLLATRTLVVPPGGLPPLDIVMSTQGGRLRIKAPEEGTRERWVVVVPTGPGDVVTTREDAGPLGLPILAPGNYEVFLFRSLDGLEYHNPAVVRAWGRGVPVRIDKGSTASVELTEYVK